MASSFHRLTRSLGGVRPLYNLSDDPALRHAQRPGLLDPHQIADVTKVLLVMRFELAGAADRLAIDWMSPEIVDRNDGRLVHLVRRYPADLHQTTFRRVLGLLLVRRRRRLHDRTSTPPQRMAG